MQRADSMVLNFEGLKMQKLNTPTERAQRVYEKNVFFGLNIVCASGVMAIKMLAMAHFMYLLVMAAKN